MLVCAKNLLSLLLAIKFAVFHLTQLKIKVTKMENKRSEYIVVKWKLCKKFDIRT